MIPEHQLRGRNSGDLKKEKMCNYHLREWESELTIEIYDCPVLEYTFEFHDHTFKMSPASNSLIFFNFSGASSDNLLVLSGIFLGKDNKKKG
jgi:hypothetical protein